MNQNWKINSYFFKNFYTYFNSILDKQNNSTRYIAKGEEACDSCRERACDTNNNIMGFKNKNSQTMKKVKRSIRMGQWPKWLKNYTFWRAGEETGCGMWILLSSIIEFFILSSVILISSSIIAYCDSHFHVILEIQKKDEILIATILFVIP